MGWSEIRPRLKEMIETVPEIGTVHEYIRHTRFWDNFFKRHVKDRRVNTWEFSRASMGNSFDSVGTREYVGCVFRREHEVVIVGRLGVDEGGESELAFQDLCDAVVSRFEANILLDGLLRIGSPPSIQSIGHQSYGGVLVHQATIVFTAAERVGKREF